VTVPGAAPQPVARRAPAACRLLALLPGLLGLAALPASEAVEKTLAELAARCAKEQEQHELALAKAKGDAVKALETTAHRAIRAGETPVVAEAWKEVLRLDPNHDEARRFYAALGQLDAVLKEFDEAADADLLGNPKNDKPLATQLAGGQTRKVGHAALVQAPWDLPFGGTFAIAKTPGRELQISGPGTGRLDSEGKIAILPADLGQNWQLSGELVRTGPHAGFVLGYDPAKCGAMGWYCESESTGPVYAFDGASRTRVAETQLSWPANAWLPFSVIRKGNQAQLAIKASRYMLTLPPGHDGERFGMLAFKDTTIQMRNLTLVVNPK
jgi:hypothetical protein